MSLIAVYGAGFAQGSVFVLIPSLGKILTAPPYSFTSSSYGILYLPEIAGAVLGALGSGILHSKYGAKGVFRLGIIANFLAMILLTSAAFSKGHSAYIFILAETLFLGIGFGFTLAAINPYAEALSPNHAAEAITILNGLIGGATAVSPLVLHTVSAWNWGLWPAFLAVLLMLLLLFPLPSLKRQINAAGFWDRKLFLIFTAVLIYAVCEGTYGSWANVYVTSIKKGSAYQGAIALSAFWGFMTVFRFIFAFVSDRLISQRTLYLFSSLGIGACFFILPYCSSPVILIAVFSLAGACCSIYYPFSMSYGLGVYPDKQTQLAGLLVAGLMIGEGIGSFAPGPLQSFLPLSRIYLASSLWVIPLFFLARSISRESAAK